MQHNYRVRRQLLLMHGKYNFTASQQETLREMDPFIIMDLKKAIVDFKNMFGGIVASRVASIHQ